MNFLNDTLSERERELFNIFRNVFGTDIKFLVILYLCKVEVASIRNIAKHVNISHKNLAHHLDYLESKGVVEIVYNARNLKLYRLSRNLNMFKTMIKSLGAAK